MSKSICLVDDCTNKPRSRGYCQTHYMRWYRTGNPSRVKRDMPASPEESFAMNTRWSGDCLVWSSASQSQEYAQIRVNGKRVGVHRYSWERTNGPIADGLFVDHICHNPSCVNVEHLRLASVSQNSSYRAGATEKNKSSGVRNVYKNRNGWRVALTKDGKQHRFGTYPTVEEAAVVAEQARKDLFGDFAGRG